MKPWEYLYGIPELDGLHGSNVAVDDGKSSSAEDQGAGKIM